MVASGVPLECVSNNFYVQTKLDKNLNKSLIDYLYTRCNRKLVFQPYSSVQTLTFLEIRYFLLNVEKKLQTNINCLRDDTEMCAIA
jgi:hypothetical protein